MVYEYVVDEYCEADHDDAVQLGRKGRPEVSAAGITSFITSSSLITTAVRYSGAR